MDKNKKTYVVGQDLDQHYHQTSRTKFIHGVILGFSFICICRSLTWFEENFFEIADTGSLLSQLSFWLSLLPVLILLTGINLILKRRGYSPINFYWEGRNLDGESASGCVWGAIVGIVTLTLLAVFVFN